ncbi:hypothetical protein JCM6882_004760 [Rhodosporidiobolus microsporus]
MSFNKLPTELKAYIVAHVAAQDRAYRTKRQEQLRLFLYRAVQEEAEDGLFRGLQALSLTSKELYSLSLSSLHQPIRLVNIPLKEYDSLSRYQCIQHCRAAHIEDWGLGSGAPDVLCQLEHLDRMRKLDSLEVRLTEWALGSLERQIAKLGRSDVGQPRRFEAGVLIPADGDHDLHNLPFKSMSLDQQIQAGALPGFSDAARQIRNWTFGLLEGPSIAVFLSISPSSIRYLSLLGSSTPLSDTLDPYETRLRDNSESQAGYLSLPSDELREALAGCNALESLHICSDSDNRAQIAVNTSWRTHSFPFVATLLTLSLDISPAFDSSISHLISRFTALKTLSLTIGHDCRTVEPGTIALPPTLKTVQLHLRDFGAARPILRALRGGGVEDLRLTVAGCTTSVEEQLYFPRAFEQCSLPSLKTVRFAILDPHNPLAYSLDDIISFLASRGITFHLNRSLHHSLSPSNPPSSDSKARAENGDADDIFKWAAKRLASFQAGEGGGVEREMLAGLARELAEIKRSMEV